MSANGFRLVGTLLIFVFFLGCGSSNPLGRLAVSGKVNLDGVPLDKGQILFEPQGVSGVGSGSVIENGLYAIPGESGLPPGKYLVRITASSDAAGGGQASKVPGVMSAPKPQRVAPLYNMNSKTIIDVPSGKSSVEFHFDVKSK